MADTVSLRPANHRDRPFIAALAAEAFAPYGDYAALLLDWSLTPGVEATIAEDEAGPAGLTLMAFVSDAGPRAGWVADILAIAVAGRARRRGLGRRLLDAAVARAAEAARFSPVNGVRLSVAEENAPARALFESAGFTYTGREDTFYPRGQRALHMRRPV